VSLRGPTVTAVQPLIYSAIYRLAEDTALMNDGFSYLSGALK